jgi:hypothetical protein
MKIAQAKRPLASLLVVGNGGRFAYVWTVPGRTFLFLRRLCPNSAERCGLLHVRNYSVFLSECQQPPSPRYVSPCNGATISGTVNFKGVVTVFEEQGQSQVFVFVTYNAPNQTGTDGNTYNARGQAVAAFDTPAPIDVTGKGHYNLPMNLDYDVSTNNNLLNFLAGTQATVDVDSNQRPTDVPDSGVNAVCGK